MMPSGLPLPFQQARRDGVHWRIELFRRKTSLVPGLDADRFHQSRHPVIAPGETGADKVSHCARQAICAITGFVAVLYCLEYL